MPLSTAQMHDSSLSWGISQGASSIRTPTSILGKATKTVTEASRAIAAPTSSPHLFRQNRTLKMVQKLLRKQLLSKLRLKLQPKLLGGVLYGLRSRIFCVDLRRASSNP